MLVGSFSAAKYSYWNVINKNEYNNVIRIYYSQPTNGRKKMTKNNITKFESKLSAKNGFHIKSTIRKHNVEIDEPEGLGGTDKGPNPVELVLAALGSCQAIVLKFYGQKLGVEVKSVETSVNGEIDLGGFFGVPNGRPGFQNIKAFTNSES